MREFIQYVYNINYLGAGILRTGGGDSVVWPTVATLSFFCTSFLLTIIHVVLFVAEVKIEIETSKTMLFIFLIVFGILFFWYINRLKITSKKMPSVYYFILSGIYLGLSMASVFLTSAGIHYFCFPS